MATTSQKDILLNELSRILEINDVKELRKMLDRILLFYVSSYLMKEECPPNCKEILAIFDFIRILEILEEI